MAVSETAAAVSVLMLLVAAGVDSDRTKPHERQHQAELSQKLEASKDCKDSRATVRKDCEPRPR